MKFEDLKKQLEWFNKIGVEKFNFSVLEKGMTNDALPRNAEEVMKAAGWAWAKNMQDMDVYLRPAVGFVQPVVFLDDLPVGDALAAAKKYSSMVIETSKGNCQVWIHTSTPLNVGQRKTVQRHLVGLLDADPGSVSGDHFGRAVCYLNRKEWRNDFPVRLVATTHHIHLSPDPYLTPSPPDGGACASPASAGRQQTSSQAGDDESRKEWGWALGWLRNGSDIEKGIQKLTARALERRKRMDERQARAYAELTFTKARRVVDVAKSGLQDKNN